MNLVKFLYGHSPPMLVKAVLSGLLAGFSGAGLMAVIGACINGMNGRGALAGAFFGLCFITVISKSYSAITLIRLSQSATLQLRVELSRKLLGTSFKKLQSIGKAELLAIFTSDISTCTQGFQTLPLVFGDGVLIASCLAYMAYLSLPLFSLIATVLAIGMISYHYAERVPLGRMRNARRQIDVMFKNFRDLIEGARELQLNARRGSLFVDDVIWPGAMKFKKLFSDAVVGYTWLVNIGAIIFLLVIGAVMFLVPLWMPVADEILVKFTLTLLYLIGPITALTSGFPTMMQAQISLTRIQQLDGGLSPIGIQLHDSDQFSQTLPLKLELKGVCHRYLNPVGDNSFMLGPLNLTVSAGEILYIVGGNGSGKTTLAMLLLGFYQPEAGVALLNGTAVSELNLPHYRRYFSAIFSDFHLFEQLIDVSDPGLNSRANAYLEKFGVAHKVKIIDGKFSDVDLSTGQRKRLALILSYLEDRPIYLFDEWAADQDPAFKRVFYMELLPDLKNRGKTVLAITHDDSYFSYADRVIKLEDGKFVEMMPTAF